MPLFGAISQVVYLIFGLVGLGLVIAGAWGSLWLPGQRAASPLTPKQRLLCTVLGLVLMASAWAMLTGRLPQGQ
jgi:hypothetical protein